MKAGPLESLDLSLLLRGRWSLGHPGCSAKVTQGDLVETQHIPRTQGDVGTPESLVVVTLEVRTDVRTLESGKPPNCSSQGPVRKAVAPTPLPTQVRPLPGAAG